MEVLWVLRERKGKDGSVFIFDTRVWQARERVVVGWGGGWDASSHCLWED